MRIIVNGSPRDIAPMSLADLIAAEDLPGEGVATAVNGDFVARPDRAATRLADGDRVEILSPRQGG